jgi:hypothetical protein
MMGSSLPAAGFQAVEVLQYRAAKASEAAPGSHNEEIAEIALGYGIERLGAVAEVQFKVYDCYRDAKRTYFRSLRRERHAVCAYRCQMYGRPVLNDNEPDFVEPVSVEDEATAQSSGFCACAVKLAGTLGPNGPAFVRRLMVGDTIAEAAVAVGISVATAYRWRSALAELLTPYRDLAEVAL